MSVSIDDDRHFCTPATMLGILHDCRYSGGISASGQSAGFGGNLFTRDTLRVLRDVMHIPQMQSFVRQMLVTLLQWQGVKDDDTTNESPNALQHQVFRQIVGGIRLDDSVVESAEYWTGQWGVPMTATPETGKQFVVYNSSDGPPLYIITLCEYMDKYGSQILNDKYVHWPTGQERTVGEGALRCVEFILQRIRKGEEAGHGLYGVPNTNPLQTSPSGIMRDGFDAYVTRSGRPADYGSMIYVENQALVYEALRVAGVYLSPTLEHQHEWFESADKVKEFTFEDLWLEDEKFFAAGLDKFGVVDMVSSSAFELLDSPFFDEVLYGSDYVRELVLRLYSPEFMTPIGCRMTSTVHAEQEGEYAPYQGSSAVWGVTNGVIERGLRRQGLIRPASDIGNRLVEWFNASREAYEMTFVDRRGIPILKPELVQDYDGLISERGVVCAAEFGQPNQAWSASAALRILTEPYPRVIPVEDWQSSINNDVADLAWSVPTLSEFGGSIARPLLDMERGKVLKEQRKQQLAAAAL